MFFRTKKDLRQYLGVALARIVNVDLPSNSTHTIEMGLGQNPDYIEGWLDEIWNMFDVDGNGYLDFDELNFFVGEVFRTSGIKIFYDLEDLKDLFRNQDDNDDG
jgi:hypothetical protein